VAKVRVKQRWGSGNSGFSSGSSSLTSSSSVGVLVAQASPAILASLPVTTAGSYSSDGLGFAAAPLPCNSGFAPPGSVPLLVGSGLDSSVPVSSLSSQAPAVLVEKKKYVQTPTVPVEEKKSSEGLED
jgi:hypothetical protein